MTSHRRVVCVQCGKESLAGAVERRSAPFDWVSPPVGWLFSGGGLLVCSPTCAVAWDEEVDEDDDTNGTPHSKVLSS